MNSITLLFIYGIILIISCIYSFYNLNEILKYINQNHTRLIKKIKADKIKDSLDTFLSRYVFTISTYGFIFSFYLLFSNKYTLDIFLKKKIRIQRVLAMLNSIIIIILFLS